MMKYKTELQFESNLLNQIFPQEIMLPHLLLAPYFLSCGFGSRSPNLPHVIRCASTLMQQQRHRGSEEVGEEMFAGGIRDEIYEFFTPYLP